MKKYRKNLSTWVDFRTHRTYFSVREEEKESRPDPDSQQVVRGRDVSSVSWLPGEDAWEKDDGNKKDR